MVHMSSIGCLSKWSGKTILELAGVRMFVEQKHFLEDEGYDELKEQRN